MLDVDTEPPGVVGDPSLRAETSHVGNTDELYVLLFLRHNPS